MRITVSSVDAFIANLEDREVYGDEIFYEKTSKPLGNQSPRDATSFLINYQASAIVVIGEGEALLQYGEDCGIDRKTADGSFDGTDRQADIHDVIANYCQARELKMKPGVLSE